MISSSWEIDMLSMVIGWGAGVEAAEEAGVAASEDIADIMEEGENRS
jgi:hypothetical protein